LGKRILQEHPEVTLAITGGPSEASAARELAARISPQVISTAGETTLRELIVLYSMADVLVTNDSGPGHFATMTDIASIVLFGPETPDLFGPLGRGSEVVRRNLACSPCVNAFNHRFSPCNDPVCMKEITVEMVYERVHLRLLTRHRRMSLPVAAVPQHS
jgi:ADP-heptose:LPS heptosyltransferase